MSKPHQPSLVLELPPGRSAYCLTCSQPWPCPDASIEQLREHIHRLTNALEGTR